MWKIEIVKPEVREITGTSKRTGQPYRLRKQEAYLHQPGQQYPQKFEILLPDDMPNGYRSGYYRLSDDALYIDRFGSLKVDAKLVPLQTKAEKAA